MRTIPCARCINVSIMLALGVGRVEAAPAGVLCLRTACCKLPRQRSKRAVATPKVWTNINVLRLPICSMITAFPSFTLQRMRIIQQILHHGNLNEIARHHCLVFCANPDCAPMSSGVTKELNRDSRATATSEGTSALGRV